MNDALFHTDCPSCGAPVAVHSATAVTVVCSYCQSMLLRQDGSLRDTGRDSALLHDFSPLQIGTQGRWAGQNFALIGRLQARYDEGAWNEWYVRFDDGTAGWLSEAGDLYVMVREIPPPNQIPEFASIRAGETTVSLDKRYWASDVREIVLENAAAQGELPFAVPVRMTNRVADFRCEQQFLTLDYATETPAAFVGRVVALADLALHNTRDDAQIRQSAGSLRGTRQSEACPSCGSPLHWIGGLTNTVICGSCGSDVNLSEGKMQLRTANAMRQAQDQHLPLPLGSRGLWQGAHYTVIGAVYRDELQAADARNLLENVRPFGMVPVAWWREYLLYAPQQGFLWLVETSEGKWQESRTQAAFPRLNAHGEPQGMAFLYDYGGRVAWAAGAFYWHIRAGDVSLYRDYRQGTGTLSSELTANEWAWSHSTPVSYPALAKAFNLKVNAPQYSVRMQEEKVSRKTVLTTIGVFIVLNLPAWLMMSGDNLFDSVMVSWIVVWILWRMAGRDEEE